MGDIKVIEGKEYGLLSIYPKYLYPQKPDVDLSVYGDILIIETDNSWEVYFHAYNSPTSKTGTSSVSEDITLNEWMTVGDAERMYLEILKELDFSFVGRPLIDQIVAKAYARGRLDEREK